MAVVESVKGATDVYSPVPGVVQKINPALKPKPALINRSAEDEGWICELSISSNDFEKSELLDRESYNSYCQGSK